MNYLLHLLIYLDIYLIVAMSLNLLIGYGGLLQVAHAAYYGLGAYVTALVMVHLGWGFLPAVGVAMLVASFLSLAVSVPAWRFRGDFFVMVSLVVQSGAYTLFYNWVSLTNGPFGLAGIPRPQILGFSFKSLPEVALLSTVVAVITILVLRILLDSPWGRLLKVMRDDELAARNLGKNTRLIKLEAFIIACAVVAVAGGLYAAYVSYIDPSSFTLNESILMLSMVIVGGTGNIRGPLVGASVLVAIPEILRFVQIPDAIAANVRLMLYGMLLIIMAHFRPQGLAGVYRLE